MSFRGRLALFFLLIVVIPIAAITLLVVDVTNESQEGKADARLSTGLTTALEIYEDEVEAAGNALTEMLASPDIQAALGSGDPAAIEDAAARGADSAGIEQLEIAGPGGEEVARIGEGEPFAAATVRSGGDGGSYEITASVTGATEYVQEVRRLTGLDVAVVEGGGVNAGAQVADASELPVAGESGDVEVGSETVRAAAGALPESESARVVVFTETEAGGFFDSRSRIVAALGLFLAVALGLILLVFRALQGQVGTMLDAARRIGSGDFSGRVPVVGRDEMAGLANEFNLMSDRLETQIEQLRLQRTELDRSVARLGEAVASGLDQDALLGIVAEAALGGCSADYAAVELEGGTLIERPEGVTGPARIAARAGQTRAYRDEAPVISRRENGHALAAPLYRHGQAVGTLAVGRAELEFDEHRARGLRPPPRPRLHLDREHHRA